MQKIFFPTKFPRYYVTEDGKVFRDAQKKSGEKILTEKVEVAQHLRGGAGGNKRLYAAVNISLRDESGRFIKQIRYYVHRLIAETLLENPHNLSEVDHINRDKLCNEVTNLRWCDHAENFRNTDIPRGKGGRFLRVDKT